MTERTADVSCPARVAIRLDANASIGSGHAMRCLSIAEQLKRRGGDAIFLVSDKDSASFLASRGAASCVLGGSFRRFGAHEANSIVRFCRQSGVSSLFVDSYAVTGEFFDLLSDERAQGLSVGYLDDQFSFELGRIKSPLRWPVDFVVNYGFSASEYAYKAVYEGASTRLCMGTGYAPLRQEFVGHSRTMGDSVRDVLVTTGSTNPHSILERIVDAGLAALPDATFTVVVGQLAEYRHPDSERVRIARGVTDLSGLMRESDLAISAAGTTLYELCATGTPTVALAIVDNQLDNLQSFSRKGLGWIVDEPVGSVETLPQILGRFAGGDDERAEVSRRMRAAVDGEGAARIADLLLWARGGTRKSSSLRA